VALLRQDDGVRECFVQWDYDMFPLRGPDGGEAEQLIPAALRRELEDWQRTFSDEAWGATGPDNPDKRPPLKDRIEHMDILGRRLRDGVAAALGPEWTVGYFSEARCVVEWPA
jgi:hypothetical protein